jgi:hypothetical protein
MIESGDFFDAFIAALAARAVHLGRYNKPTGAQLEMARGSLETTHGIAEVIEILLKNRTQKLASLG